MEPGKRILFAAPTLVIASIFLLAGWGDGYFLPGTNKASLAHVMQIEYLVIVSGLFLVFPAVFEPRTIYGRIVRALIFLALATTFATAAYSINSWAGLISYAVLAYACFGGNTLLIDRRRAVAEIGMLAPVRWIINLPIFFALLVWFDLGKGNIASWDNAGAVISFGASFFCLLFFLELILYYSLAKASHERQALRAAAQAESDAIDQRKIRYYSLFK